MVGFVVSVGLDNGRILKGSDRNGKCGLKMVYGAYTQKPNTYQIKVMQKDRCTVINVPAENDLRTAMLASNVDLYTLGGKFRNCGGNGACGTCIVDVLEGVYGLTPRTMKEESLLQGKPASWRLACRAQVTGENVVVSTKPQ
mmetsp:Transcript_57/g.90  ORF Transcript_57/g.90 Transcript_57/m.90 type:complete len:142 (-) Transcript_57:2016-2441(-)